MIRHAAALAVYAALAAVLLWHGASLTHQLSGAGADPWDSPWFLAWWPYALTHHLDPFFTRLIWYPCGVSLLWVTSVPLLAVLAMPLTLLAGPVLTYNIYILTAPVCAACFAYLLCHRLTRDFAASLIGGFLFGFSSYEMAQDSAALNLAVTFLVPALLLVALKRLDDELSRPATAALAALLLLAQFLICPEVFAMIFVFGGMAWALAYLHLPARRAGLKRLFIDGLITGPFVALPLAPLFVVMARDYWMINHPVIWPYYFTADLANLVIPSAANLFGGFFTSISQHFSLSVQEQDAYLGLPLLVLIYLFARGQGREPRGRYLVACFLVLLVCELGPQLWVAGHITPVVLPWMLLVKLPLLGSALSARFTLFTALAAGVIAAYWLALPGARRWRLALGGLTCVALLPGPHPWREAPYAAFFQPGRVQAVLGPNPRLLVLPFALHGPSSFWQMENGFGYTQVGGYLGFPPRPAQSFKAVGEMFGGMVGPGFAGDFVTYARAAGAQYVVAGPGTQADLLAAITTLGWPRRQVDDVTIFSVPETK
ncbi:MAG: hypothetical protein ACLPJJ_09525 [Acidocella sp.]|uniref:hypothetical protein n=1 Tax=Acidocella sp. TaxID=50710 RepID=UPI003FD75FD1